MNTEDVSSRLTGLIKKPTPKSTSSPSSTGLLAVDLLIGGRPRVLEIWGPPSSGKTSFLIAATTEALLAEQNVLVASSCPIEYEMFQNLEHKLGNLFFFQGDPEKLPHSARWVSSRGKTLVVIDGATSVFRKDQWLELYEDAQGGVFDLTYSNTVRNERIGKKFTGSVTHSRRPVEPTVSLRLYSTTQEESFEVEVSCAAHRKDAGAIGQKAYVSGHKTSGFDLALDKAKAALELGIAVRGSNGWITVNGQTVAQGVYSLSQELGNARWLTQAVLDYLTRENTRNSPR